MNWLEEAQARDKANRAKVKQDIATFLRKLRAALSAQANVTVRDKSNDSFSISMPGKDGSASVSAHTEFNGGSHGCTGRFSVRAGGKLWRARKEWPDTLLGEIAAYTLHALAKQQAEQANKTAVENAASAAHAKVLAAGVAEGAVYVSVDIPYPYDHMKVRVQLPELTVEQAIQIAKAARSVLGDGG